MISLCYRAGFVKQGRVQIEDAFNKNKVKLLIMADDISNNTQKKFTDLAINKNVNYIIYSSKYNLGKIIGKDERSALAVCDYGFANKIRLLYKEALINGKNESK